MKFTKRSFNGYFTDNRKDKIKRFPKTFWSFLGTIIFTLGLILAFIVLYFCAYACM